MSAQTKSAYARPSPGRGAARVLLRELRSTRDRSSWPESPPGQERPAMLIPGFLAGEPSLARMALWLRGGGWQPARPGIRLNVNCMEPAVKAVERRLEDVVEHTGHRALVVGQSRGGTFGRVLAVRRPELIETLVTLGSPVLDELAVSGSILAMTHVVRALGTLGVPGLLKYSCRGGACCEVSRSQLAQPVPENVRYIAFYSRDDAVVSWEACLDPGAELVEIGGTHTGMGMNRAVWSRMATLLGD